MHARAYLEPLVGSIESMVANGGVVGQFASWILSPLRCLVSDVD